MAETIELRALSLRQPWAWLVLHRGKDIENRRWSTKFRGRFLIHAALGVTPAEYEWARDWCGIELPPPKELLRGGIVGHAHLFDVLDPQDVRIGWHMQGQYGFRLADIQATSFLPLQGRLCFFKAICPLDWARSEGLAA